MRIEQRVIGPCITNVYLLISEKNNAVLIDPADDADQISESSPPDSKNQMELPKLVGSGLSGS